MKYNINFNVCFAYDNLNRYIINANSLQNYGRNNKEK